MYIFPSYYSYLSTSFSNPLKNRIMVKHYLSKNRVVAFITLFLLTLFGVTNNAYSQVSSGSTEVCLGQSVIYQVPPGTSLPILDWEITPATSSSISYSSNSEIEISWTEGGVFDISNISGGPAYSVTVYDPVNPYLTWDKEVGCTDFDFRFDSEGHVYILDENQCVNACEHSIVTYTVNTQTNWYGSIPEYNWNVIGGVITAINGTAQPTPYQTSYSGPETNLTITWGAAGTSGFITLEESLPNILCANTEFELCVNVIEIPEVDYVINSTIHPIHDDCNFVCQYANLYFEGMATVSPGSQIVSWKWEFNDPDPSQPEVVFLQNASHHFDTPGQYEVTLTVTNDCNCSNRITYLICVVAEEMTKIICADPICEGSMGNYTLEDPGQCASYQWSAIGGLVVGPSVDPEVQIQWTGVDDDGFGYVVLDGPNCGYSCPMDIVLKVPVIKNHVSIKGETTVCVNESFVFSVPAWPATNYLWEVVQTGTNASINTYAQNSHMIEVFSGTAEGTYTLKCTFINTLTEPACQGYASQDILVRAKPEISALEKLCNTDWDLDCSLSGIGSTPSVRFGYLPNPT